MNDLVNDKLVCKRSWTSLEGKDLPNRQLGVGAMEAFAAVSLGTRSAPLTQ